MQEIGTGKSIAFLYVFSVEGLALYVARDHRPDLYARTRETRKVLFPQFRRLADNRESEGGKRSDMVVPQDNQIIIFHHELFQPQVILFPALDILLQKLHLVLPQESGDFRRAHIETEVVESIFGLEFRADIEFFPPFMLLLGGEVPVPAVGAHDAQHFGEILIVGTNHSALNGGHVVCHKKGKTCPQAKIAGFS